MKKLISIVLSLLFFTTFFFSSSCIRDESNEVENNLHPELYEAITLVIEDAKKEMQRNKYFEERFYLVRFFEYKNAEYATIGVLENFPLLCSQFKDKSLYYDYDSNLMYYFNVNGKNVVIMDYPKNAENPFFRKKQIRNDVVPIIRNIDRAKTFSGFKMYLLKTFLVYNNDDNPRLILNPEIILSPPYPSEVGLKNIEIIDVK